MKNRKPRMNEEVKKILRNFKSRSDPSGCYTGNSLDGDKPVQDADDI